MTVIEIQFNEQTLAQIQREATQQQAQLETLIQELIERLVMTKVGESTLLSLVAQEPGLMKDLAVLALAAREHDAQRIADSDPILALGSDPVTIDITDASENHDIYLYTL
jgi:hypothetical protein